MITYLESNAVVIHESLACGNDAMLECVPQSKLTAVLQNMSVTFLLFNYF